MTPWRRALLAFVALSLACGRGEPGATTDAVRIVLRYQPLGPDAAPLERLVAQFERENPGVHVALQTIPNDSDLAHQLLVTALGAGAEDLDCFVVDVVWVAEFTRAGWLADLSDAFPPERIRSEYIPGAAETVVRDGRTRAVPWFADVALLYYRTDLVPSPPRTAADLEAAALAAKRADPRVAGYLWQGRQYEGLSCNFFEALWARGGAAEAGGRLVLDSPEARAALAWLRGLLERGVSPPSVAVSSEEDARRAFQEGRAAFMRNWPYAWPLLQAKGSPVRGRVAVAPIPSEAGAPGAGTLGGWQLAVSARSPPERRAAAVRLVRHLTSPSASLVLALHYGRNQARRGSYADPEVRSANPFVARLLPLLERARPRPASPYYMLVADALQGELSAAISGMRPPADALRRAQTQANAISGAGQ